MIGPADIVATIPHRPPILMLDRVSELVPRKRLTGHLTVTGSELRLGERTPGRLPQPLLVESWAQAALMLLMWEGPNPDVRAGQVAVVGVVEGVRFGRPADVGDEVEHRVALVRRYGDMAVVRGTAVVAGAMALEIARMVVALRATDALGQPR